MNIFNSITKGLEEAIKVESNEKEKMMFNYKVKDLIEELKKLPQELPVLTDGYEGDYENILKPFISILFEDRFISINKEALKSLCRNFLPVHIVFSHTCKFWYLF